MFEVCIRDQACLRLFLCVWYRQHRKFKLEKSKLNTKKWGKSRFDEILELWIFILDYFVAPAFCSIPVSWFDFFCFCTIMLDKETWRKDYWFLFFICSLVWFLYTAKCEFSSKLRVGLPRVVLVLPCVLFVPEILVSPLSEFEQHMYSSDPRPDNGSLMQLESRRAVPQVSQAPYSKASARTF